MSITDLLLHHDAPAAKHRSGNGLAISEKALRDGRLGSDFILSAIQDGVMMVSHDNVVHLFNPAASSITGWVAEEAVGIDYHSVLVLVDEKGTQQPPENHPFNRVLATGQTVREDSVWLNTKTGKRIAISLVVSPVLDGGERPTGSVVGVFRDITVQKQEEAHRSEFISTASHEMRTPLTAIEGYLALALNEKISKVDDNARKYIEKARTATKDLGVLFQDLLTSSKAEDGRLVSYPVVVEIGETVERMVESEKVHAQEKGLDLQFQVSGNNDVNGGKVIRPIFYAYADPHRIYEVLQNIIDNAVKYTITGGVTVRLTGDPSVIQIQISDTGQGIPEEDIPHLFQKFYRVDSSLTRSVGGTGLGLFICKKIIELYNGQIWVESQLGKGSTFFINLPRLTAEQALHLQQSQASTISPLEPQR
jgi:PAS domain S-box-containing protein